MPKNRVFWTLCKIASLVFSDFWQKDRVQGTLKFSGKFFSVVNYRFSFFGEISLYHFPVTLIIVANKLFLVFLSNFDGHFVLFFSVPTFLILLPFLFPFLYLSIGRSNMQRAC